LNTMQSFPMLQVNKIYSLFLILKLTVSLQRFF